ncbi:hypothetical protein BDN70DRAFT_874336 [Pholiota conissans]|uniref:Uncharacterized protein n=1 Tax=Pholiota conissans TaxID=109636 RepID=A0A9P5Z7A3_9AGAR|nr:hypothetical protein BDN70DRAFT_874336 [Pholiota conissans]
MDAVLSWMKFPALQHIVTLEQCSSLYALISRSSCPLKTLELRVDNRAIHQEELISLLTELPSLVTVRLKDGSCGRQDIGYCIDPLVSRLSESVRCAGAQSFLPHLKTLNAFQRSC